MAVTILSPADAHLGVIRHVITRINEVILGKEPQVRLALACLLARGHLLIEDLPGVGKTILAHALARVMGLQFKRIQFTSDLLPADVLGVSVYERDNARFSFHPGPVFSQVILADEINRATPKTQSALLEAMEEHQVSIEGETRALPEPFFVIATQNPVFHAGTFPLPESQLDRFLMRIDLGYPQPEAERALLSGRDRRAMVEEMIPVLSAETLTCLQEAASGVHVSDALLDYLQAILAYSRQSGRYQAGLSPRAGMAALHGAQAWALIEGRDHVLPEDLQAVLPAVASHRLHALDAQTAPGNALVRQLISEIPVP